MKTTASYCIMGIEYFVVSYTTKQVETLIEILEELDCQLKALGLDD